MRERKQSDSPSGATRDVYPLRNRTVRLAVKDYERRVLDRATQLLAEQPHLAGEDPRVLFSRMVVPATVVDYESALTRAAMGVLLVAALDRRDVMDITSGDAA